jgi:transmembrane sensor
MSSPDFHLAGAYRPDRETPGFAIPVFGHGERLWTQDADAAEKLIGFKLCDIEAAALLPISHGNQIESRRVGDARVYGFYFPGSRVVVAERECLADEIRTAHPAGFLGPFALTDVAEFLRDDALLKSARQQAEAILSTYGTRERNDGELAIVDEHEPHDEWRQAQIAPRRRHSARPSWIAIVALIAIVAALLHFMAPSEQPSAEPWVFETKVAERARVELTDGSTIQLGPLTSVTATFTPGARSVVMDRGEALFNVAHDAKRAFRVQVGAGVITAVGTSFNVRRLEQQVVVTVSEGAVEVAPENAGQASAGTRVASGKAVSYDAKGNRSAVHTADVGTALAWRNGVLQYKGEPLSYVVQDVNRSSRRKVSIADEAAGRILFTGTIVAAEIDDWLAALGEVFPELEAVPEDNDHVVIRMRQPR